MMKNTTALMAAALLTLPATSFAAMAGANTVNSAAIVDGSIATVDIANLAITSAKIANGAVTATQLGAAAVTNAKLAAGAVTDATISDVAMGKVTGLATALGNKADLAAVNTALAGKAAVNHSHLIGNTAIVATEGGEYTNPVTAMNDIANWCGTPSAANPCLMKIMPGVYNIGATALTMQPFVDIQGSGENVTKITGTNTWVVWGADNAELSNLTITATGSAFYALANSSASPKITHVTAISDSSSNGYTVTNESCAPIFSDVTIISHGGIMSLFNSNNYNGIYTPAASFTNLKVINDLDSGYGIVTLALPVTFHGLEVTTSGAHSQAVWSNQYYANPAQGTIIDGATISGAGKGIWSEGLLQVNNSKISVPVAVQTPQGTTVLTSSMINGTIGGDGAIGTFKCISSYDGNYSPLTCP